MEEKEKRINQAKRERGWNSIGGKGGRYCLVDSGREIGKKGKGKSVLSLWLV